MAKYLTVKPTDVVATPTDAQVAAALNNWLDANPEAITTVADGSITPEKTSWMRPVYNNEYNTADPDALDGYFFYSGTSAATTGGGTAAYSVSGFIPVAAGRQYCFNYIRAIRWLDSDKAFISYDAPNGAVGAILIAPENAAYVRFDVTTANKEAAYMYEYVGVSFDFAAYHSSHILVSNEDAYDDFLALTVGKKVSEGALDLGAVIPAENLHLRQLSGMDEWRWNIVNPDTCVMGTINANTGADGTFVDNDTNKARRTDYIPVTPGEELHFLGFSLFCYDADKVFLQTVSQVGGKATIPDGVAYIRAYAINSAGNVPTLYIMRNKYGTAYTYLDTVDYNDVIPQLKNPERLENYKVYLGLYKWGGKSFCFIGDSFSAPGTWQNEMCDRLMAVYTANPSVSGGRWSDTADPACAYEQAQSLVSGGYAPDVIFCMLGANDGGNAVTLGNIVESTDIADFDLTTYTGGMQACINYLQNNFPDAVIYVGWTPAGANCNFVSASAAETYIERMKELCLMYGVEYLEVRTCGITKYSAAYAGCFEMGTGGGHPTNAGHLKIGEYMARLIG